MSALNHVLHRTASELKFNKEVNSAFGDKADTSAPANGETVDEVISKVETLKNQQDDYNGNVNIDVSDRFQSGNGDDALTYTHNGKLDGNPHVTLFRASFDSYRYLARVLYHEFVHVNDFLSGRILGDYYRYCDRFGEYRARNIARNLSEVRAYQSGLLVTGQNYTSGYYKAINYLNSQGVNY